VLTQKTIPIFSKINPQSTRQNQSKMSGMPESKGEEVVLTIQTAKDGGMPTTPLDNSPMILFNQNSEMSPP